MKSLFLPNLWASCEIEDILEAQSDGKLIHQGWSPQCEKEPAGLDEWGVLKTTAIQDGFFLEHENKRLPESKEPKTRIEVKNGDLLVTNAGPRSRCGVICFVRSTRNKLMISGKMYRLRFPESLICPEYIESWLRTSFAQKALNDRKTGISESGLNMTQAKFKTLPVVVAPFAEQKAITEKLNTLLAKVEATKARLESTLETLKQFRQSVLAAAVSGKLTEDWRLSNGIKSSWQDLTLGDVIINGPQNGIYKPSKLYGSGTKIIRIDGFYDGELCDWSSFKRVLVEEQEKDKWALKENDILINRVNSIEYLGKCGLVRSLPEDAIFESNIMRISVNEGKAIPEFIKIFLTSLIGLDRLRANAKLAVNQASINQKDVKSCQLELPEFNEQQEIIRRVNLLFSGTDVTEQQIHQALERVNNLTQSILVKAFQGELTEQWRRDNPELVSGENSAEALLEKIKAERAALKSVKKSRK